MSTVETNSDSGVNVLITTYPQNGSRNVGDALISDSAVKLIRYRVPEYDPMIVFRESSLDHIQGNVRTILAPGFSVNDKVYPNLFKLYDDIGRLPEAFFPVGCSFQHLVPLEQTYVNHEYSEETLSFLRSVARRSGPLPCRDLLTVEMLKRNKIPAFYCGDLALYDDTMIGTHFSPPTDIKSVVFTIQHKPKFAQQSFAMLDLIKSEFPKATLYVAHHSRINEYSRTISEYATKIGFVEKDLSGSAQNLDFYDEVDLHIGYRLHGHISFLRRRKPSCLLVEDSRSFGISSTGSLGLGAIFALHADAVTVDQDAPKRLIQFLRRQIALSFEDYREVFTFIDKTYGNIVRPYFDLLCYRMGFGILGLKYSYNCVVALRLNRIHEKL